MEEQIFQELLRLAKKAASKHEVPISALIVKDHKIIAKAYNTREKTKCIYNHAEILALKKAAKKLKTWHLETCDLYVTLKPCSMCEAVIKQSRIKNVYYLLNKDRSKKEYYKTKFAKANISTTEIEYAQCLSEFFQNKRAKNKNM